MGPMGSGKTSIACVEAFLSMRRADRPLRWLVIRESHRELQDSTLKTWEEWFGSITRNKVSDKVLEVTFPNYEGKVLTHLIHYRHARRAQDATKFLSTEYAGIWLEECVPAYERDRGVIGGGIVEEIFNLALLRLRQRDAPYLEMLLTFNPPSKYHWTYKRFVAKSTQELSERQWALFRQPAKENSPNLPPGYYDIAIAGLDDPDLIRRFVDGECVTVYPGQRVFTCFTEAFHFPENLRSNPDLPLILGFDFGRTPCCLVSQVTTSGRLNVLYEFQMVDSGIEKFAERLAEELKDRFPDNPTFRCWADPAGNDKGQTDEKSCYDILASQGFECRAGARTYVDRLESVIQRAGRFIDNKPGIQIDRNRCPMLMEALLGAYRYPKSDDGQIGSSPIKNHPWSDLADSLQYICSGEFETRRGYRPGARAGEEAAKLPSLGPLRDNPPRQTHHNTGWMAH